jgi:arylsulfatase A-like enzyme
LLGNYNFDHPSDGLESLPMMLRAHGYQTALIGKSHMTDRLDRDGFEHRRYTDLIDSDRRDPLSHGYFAYLASLGLADLYEEGAPPTPDHSTMTGARPAKLTYEHSIEHYTGSEALAFLGGRDVSRPFFLKLSFQRPHAPIAPAREFFDLYNPESIPLPPSADDWFDRRFAGKPEELRRRLLDFGWYPLAQDTSTLKRCLASYYALITAIDSEIGRVTDHLRAEGMLDSTFIIYTSDHGDFAGEHGLFHKNLGIYESVHRVPLLISRPDQSESLEDSRLIESVDLMPTILNELGIPCPDGVDGTPIDGSAGSKEAAFCEWNWKGQDIIAIRTERYRLVYYSASGDGELYDVTKDPGETENLWQSQDHAIERESLTRQLLAYSLRYEKRSDSITDQGLRHRDRLAPGYQLQFGLVAWSAITRGGSVE